jgi:hypothetical protein
MTSASRFPRRLLAVAIALVLLLLTIPAASAAPDLRLSWSTPGDRVRFDNGWSLTTTTNPMIEVRKPRGGGVIGIVELLSFPVDNHIARAETAEARERVLRALIAEHHDAIGEDRRESLGSGYQYVPRRTTSISFGSTPALRYAAVTKRADGTVVERHLGYMAVKRGQLWVFAVDGYDHTVFPSDVIQLTPERQQVLARHTDELVEASPLPREGSGLSEGIVVGTEGGLDGGRIFLLHDGRKQRISQPRPMTVDDASRYDRGARIAQLDVIPSDTGSFFAVVPADGPSARLQVIIGDTIHEVVVQHVTADLVETIDNLQRDVTDQLVVAGAD